MFFTHLHVPRSHAKNSCTHWPQFTSMSIKELTRNVAITKERHQPYSSATLLASALRHRDGLFFRRLHSPGYQPPNTRTFETGMERYHWARLVCVSFGFYSQTYAQYVYTLLTSIHLNIRQRTNNRRVGIISWTICHGLFICISFRFCSQP